MTLIEDQGTEAIMEILSLLEGRVKRCGRCQVSSLTIRKTLRMRFGLKGPSGTYLQNFVEGYLRGSGIVTVSNTTGPKNKRIIVYDIDPAQLESHLLGSEVLST